MPISPTDLPEAFAQRMTASLGAAYDAFSQALQAPAPVSLRANPFKYFQPFEGAQPVPWCEGGYYLPERPAFYKDPAIFAGGYYVQEASSMFLHTAIKQCCDLGQPLAALDLCAAPGGKSTLIASLLSPDSLLVSNEIVGKRVLPLQDNLIRWGTANTVVTNNRPSDFAPLRQFFDLIVVDAPCSGEGMFRKDPKVAELWRERLPFSCAENQQQILTDVFECLRPDGVLLYSTCTFASVENEENIAWLADQGNIEPIRLTVPAEWGIVEVPISTGQGIFYGYRFYPHLTQGEGFFLCPMRRTSNGIQMGRSLPKRNGKLDWVPRKQQPTLQAWLDEPDRYAFFQESADLTALPESLTDWYLALRSTLRVRMAGIDLGRFKGQDLVPDHALSQTFHLAKDVANIALDYEQAVKYLHKQDPEIETAGLRDWVLVTYQGNALGWVKVLSNRVNNAYPSELRIRKEF